MTEVEQIDTGTFKFKIETKEDIIEKQQAAVKSQTHLALQSLDNFDPALLTPLNPEVISR